MAIAISICNSRIMIRYDNYYDNNDNNNDNDNSNNADSNYKGMNMIMMLVGLCTSTYKMYAADKLL